MGKSLIPQIAEMLGVGFDEEFKIQDFRGNPVDSVTYKFDENTLLYKHQDTGKFYIASSGTLLSLLDGGYEIVKLPWKPKNGDEYWTFVTTEFGEVLITTSYNWHNNYIDFLVFKAGWVFRSEEDAEDMLPAVAKEMGLDYRISVKAQKGEI